MHRVRMLAVQKYECQPVWIPLIRLSVRQRVTHPLAYGLLSRNSSTHTLTPTSRTVTLGMNHRGVEANLTVFRSSVRHWMPIVPAKGLSGYSRCVCVCVCRPYLNIQPPGSWSCLPANGFRFRSEFPPVRVGGRPFRRAGRPTAFRR